MNINKSLSIPSVLGLLLLGQSAQAFDNSSLNGCYASSLYGNMLGPQITVVDGQLVPDAQTLVLHGTASVGLVCFDGMGVVTEVSATQNVAGLCTVSYTGTGTYTVLPNGTGTASLSTTIPSDAVLPSGCALLGVQAGDQATFDFSSVLDGQGCFKVVGLSLVPTEGAPIPLTTEGEACQQTAEQ